jgi:hypothetical protein
MLKGVEMSQKCSQCGAILSTYNSGRECFPCQKKRKDTIVEKIASSSWERPEYLDFLLVSKKSEKTRALPQKMAAPAGIQRQSVGSGSTRSQQDSYETAEERRLNWKPRVQISLNPLACKMTRTARLDARPKMA